MNPEELLTEKCLRKTQVRIDLLKIFSESEFAISAFDINERLNKTYDEATLYRTLKIFNEQGLIHQVPSDQKTAYFALTRSRSNISVAGVESHAHLKCKECGHTFCVRDVKFGDISSEGNFKADFIDIVIYGSCESCTAPAESN